MSDKLSSLFSKHLNQLLSTIQPEKINSTPHLIVALSGGLDSVVLLHLLSQYQQAGHDIKLSAHNINHGLSENAESWAQFCESICEQWQVNFIASQVIIEKKSRTSLEAVARELRYQCLKKEMAPRDIVLTGHHQDDQLETLLLALKRGAGSTGLQGIRSSQLFSEGYLLRPLLLFSRDALMDYAHHYQLKWIEDESNQNIDFDRNFIRHHISPLLKQRWPAMAQSASRSAQLCQEQQSLLDEVAEQDLALCSSHHFEQQRLSINMPCKLTEARRNNVIRYWIKSHHVQYPSSKQLSTLWQEVALAKEEKQPKLQLQSVSICRYQGHLYIVPNIDINLPPEPIQWAGEKILWLVEDKLGVDFSNVTSSMREHNVQCCLRSHLNAQLTCQPLGRNKPRSIKKLLHEYNVPTWLRDHVVFVFVDNQLVQAVGLWNCSGSEHIKMDLTLLKP